MANSYRQIREEVPEHVTILAAAKTRAVDEIRVAIDAGVTDIGENYVQEGEHMRALLGGLADTVRWHMIGHLQRNKVSKALAVFDVIQTVDSVKLARAIEQRATGPVPVLIEINSAREPGKSGVAPEDAEQLVREIARLEKVAIRGLMTMGPASGDPEEARPCFRETKRCFDMLAAMNIPNVEMSVLSMGMSDSYRVAIEEGSTMIRLGTVLFGPRNSPDPTPDQPL